MSFDFGNFELVSGFGVVVLATAIGAAAMVLRDVKLLLAVMTFPYRNNPVDIEFAIFNLLAVLDGGGPTFMHKPRDDARGFANS